MTSEHSTRATHPLRTFVPRPASPSFGDHHQCWRPLTSWLRAEVSWALGAAADPVGRNAAG
jgi:hypothetical protein